MNGLANPRGGEWMLDMRPCHHLRFDSPGSVTVGAGAAVWDVHRHLAGLGLGLKVFNDGDAAASSLGGYLSAGGFGETSGLHGGFWETVDRVILVDGTGKIHQVDRQHTLFPWLFGSMGQLGIAYELMLQLDRPERVPYPYGSSLVLTASQPQWEPLRWFTLLVPQQPPVSG